LFGKPFQQRFEALAGDADLVGEVAIFALELGDALAQGLVFGAQRLAKREHLADLFFEGFESIVHAASLLEKTLSVKPQAGAAAVTAATGAGSPARADSPAAAFGL
jgi:hypothetical protein